MKKIFTILLTLLSFCSVFSQTVKKTNTNKSTTQSTTETPSKIRVFSPSASSSSSKSDNSYKWAVKTDVISFITGEFPIIGEYRITEKFSVEGSVGLTYGYLNSTFLESDELNTVSNNTNFIESDNAKMGTSFRASIKYFPSSDYDAIEGWYFGIQLMSKTTNRGYAENQSSYSITGKDTKVKTGIAIIIGKQVFSDSNIIIDSYFGGGIASTKHTFYSYDYQNEVAVENENTVSQPNILFGLRIGFGN